MRTSRGGLAKNDPTATVVVVGEANDKEKAPPAPMPLQLHLAIGRCGPQLWLGLGQLCRHACTSWLCAIWCIASLASAVFSPAAELPLPVACPDLDGEHDDQPSSNLRTLGRLRQSRAPRAIHHDSQKPCHPAVFLAETLYVFLPLVRPSPDPMLGPMLAPLSELKRRGWRFLQVMPFLWELPPQVLNSE
jgi:hypothetical protein